MPQRAAHYESQSPEDNVIDVTHHFTPLASAPAGPPVVAGTRGSWVFLCSRLSTLSPALWEQVTSWEGQPGVTWPSFVVISSAVLPAPWMFWALGKSLRDLASPLSLPRPSPPWPTPQVGVLSEVLSWRSPASPGEECCPATAHAQGKYTRPGASSAQGSDQWGLTPQPAPEPAYLCCSSRSAPDPGTRPGTVREAQ